MGNTVTVRVTVFGTKERIEKFKNNAVKTEVGSDGEEINLEKLTPMPEELAKCCARNSDYWGNGLWSSEVDKTNSRKHFVFRLQTKNSPPTLWFELLCKEHPELNFFMDASIWMSQAGFLSIGVRGHYVHMCTGMVPLDNDNYITYNRYSTFISTLLHSQLMFGDEN